MSELKLFLLGSPRVELDGVAVTINRRKALALLLYLAITGKSHGRDTLAVLLYPDSDQSQGRAYLRRDLATLNSTLSNQWLVADRETIELKPGFWLDVSHFQQLVDSYRSHRHPPQEICSDCISLLSQALELYTGDFLTGFTLRDSAEFDDWQFFQAESLRQDLAFALENLVQGLTLQEQYSDAILYTRRWIALDPLHEPAQRRLIQLYDQAGQPSAAIRQYEEFVALLEAEIGLPPEEKTSTLYEAIKAKRILAPYLKTEAPEREKSKASLARGLVADRQPVADHELSPSPGAQPDGSGSPARVRPTLPISATEFVGREQELAKIRQLLVEDSTCRLLTLVGPGGIGKTRLALAVANEVGATFFHRVYFVPLAPLDSPERMVSTLANILNFSFYEGQEPKQQLLDHLRSKQMLLVMDNFEHILDGARLVSEILQAAPEVKILATSRQRLNLSSEILYSISGLTIPRDDASEALLKVDAVRLLIQQARLARPDFKPDAEDIVAMGRISRLTEGMPLALVLAAGWSGVLSFKEIATEIAQNLDILETDLHDVPDRQRSVRAVFDSSWVRLSPDEQQVLMKLSVFRGGFHRQAAQAVAGGSLRILRELVQKSLVSFSGGNRYELHELLRQYAAERLDASLATDSTQEAHSRYYLDFLRTCQPGITGPQQLELLNEIEADIENIRRAWQWAVEHDQIEALEHSLESLYHFYTIRSQFQEGKADFRMATKRLQHSSSALSPSQEKVLGKLLAREGAFSYALSLIQPSTELLQQSLKIAQRFEDQRELAFALNFLGELARVQGEHEAALRYFNESLTHSRKIGDELRIAHSLKGLGWAAGEEGGAYLESQRYYQEALAYYRAAGNRAEIAFCLDKLGHNAWQLGDYAEAEPLSKESLAIFREIGDPVGIAKALGALALVYMNLGGKKLAEAKALARESLETCQETGHRLEIANRFLISGLVALEQDEVDEGQRFFQEALKISKQISFRGGITLALNGLGEVAYKQGNFQEARKCLIEALKTAVATHRVQDISELIVNFAALLIQEVHHGVALAEAEARVKAVEILSLASNYPGSWQRTQERTTRLLAELASELDPEVIAAARQRGKSKMLGSVVAEILEVETVAIPFMNRMAGEIEQRFVQEDLIATGGMGEVYRGRDLQTGTPVAIKRLRPELTLKNPEAVQRLRREGEILRQLNHPNIVKVLATSEAGGQPIIVMEYVSGGSLHDLLSREPKLPLERALEIGLELADALARVHHLDILHRDLKPANILLAEDGTPRLSDFGVAYLGRADIRLTQEGTLLGTTIYLSPEAWRGEALDIRSDIWSFGAVLYEMLAGQPPFAAEHLVATMTAILNEPLPDLSQFRPEAPSALVELINHMLVKDRQLRLDSMRQVAAALERIRHNIIAN